MAVQFTSALIDQIIKGRCSEFADLMGMHKAEGGQLQVNVFLPGATAVEVLNGTGKKLLGTLSCLHKEGLFSALIPGRKLQAYRLRVFSGDTTRVLHDPYCFGRSLDAAEVQLFAEGRMDQAWQLLGAQPRTLDDCDGVHFVLWAPDVRRASVILPATHWDGRVHVMRRHAAAGLWELFIPALPADTPYKFELMKHDLRLQLLHFDAFAQRVEAQPQFCSRPAVPDTHVWQDHFWKLLHANQGGQQPVVIHDFSLSDFLRTNGLGWSQLGTLLLPELKSLGFSHLLVRDGHARISRGQAEWHALLSPPPELGPSSELQQFIDTAHDMELAVLWDLPLATLLPQHDAAAHDGMFDWLQFGGALASLVLGCIGYWHERLHVDGFRFRDLDRLLALSQCNAGPWRDVASSAFAREWLGSLLASVRARFPSLLLLAESSANWPELTQRAGEGGIGFDYRLESLPVTAGDTLARLHQQIARFQQGNRLQQLICHAPPVSVDDALQQVFLLAHWALPGRKLLRLDFHQLQTDAGWQPESGHDWQLQLGGGLSAATRALIRQLNFLYQANTSLYEQDTNHEGINVLYNHNGAFVFERISRHAAEATLIIVNTGQTAHSAVRVRPQQTGNYRVLCQAGATTAVEPAAADRSGLLTLDLPACTALICAIDRS